MRLPIFMPFLNLSQAAHDADVREQFGWEEHRRPMARDRDTIELETARVRVAALTALDEGGIPPKASSDRAAHLRPSVDAS